jgi:hypothetical protein
MYRSTVGLTRLNTNLLYSLIFSGVNQIPPAAAVNYVPWAIVGFISQYIIRRRYFPYWAKYNCKSSKGLPWHVPIILMNVTDVLSAALDAGTAIGVILVYFWLVETCFISNFLLTGMPAFNTQCKAKLGSIRYNDGGVTLFTRTRAIGLLTPLST